MDEQPGDDPRAGVVVRRHDVVRASAPGVVLDHPHQRAHARHHPRRRCDRSPLYTGADRRHRPALLPVDRGQGGALRRQGLAPDLRRARGPGRLPRSTRTASRPRCRSTCSWRWCAVDPRPRARAHHPAGLRDRVRLLRSARAEGLAGDQGGRRAVLRRPDQRHHRLRGSGRAGPGRRRQRRARYARRAKPGARVATRPTSAC